MKKSIYIYVVNRKQFNAKSKEMETFEEVSIKDKMVSKLLEQSSFVLDLVDQKIIKNRFEHTSEKVYTYDSVMEYLRKNHSNVVDVEQKYKEMMEMFQNAMNNISEENTQVVE